MTNKGFKSFNQHKHRKNVMSDESKTADSIANNALWLEGLCQTRAEQRIFDAIMNYAKEKNVTVQRALAQPLTTFKTNSPSFYDEDRKKMCEKFGKIGAKFVKQASKKFIDSRISNIIKIRQLHLTIESGFNTAFLVQKPYAQLVLTIQCWEMDGFEDEQSEQNRETNN